MKRRPLWRQIRGRAAALCRLLVRRLAARLARLLAVVIAASPAQDLRAARDLSARLRAAARALDAR
jgi:hypothetical protein